MPIVKKSGFEQQPQVEVPPLIESQSVELRGNIPKEMRRQFRVASSVFGLTSTDALKIAVAMFLAKMMPTVEIILSQKQEMTGMTIEEIISNLLKDYEILSARRKKNFSRNSPDDEED